MATAKMTDANTCKTLGVPIMYLFDEMALGSGQFTGSNPVENTRITQQIRNQQNIRSHNRSGR